ncbi:MAG: SOS response-associated peptidase [Methanomicrobiales archaeon]|nr:SOS response-associated peptidase [Methanomicrobiales archaeon]
MCGRYSLICIDDLGNRFRVHNPMIGSRSHFNISPASEMPVIVRNDAGNENAIVPMRWGLVPHWAQDPKTAQKPINARAETLLEKPMFAPLVRSHRCLVPASGFFEWKKEGKRKIPFYFTVPGQPLFAFAGLFSQWKSPDGTVLSTYTIITCPANVLLAGVHDRMPVILAQENESRWLSQEPLAPGDLAQILAPFPAAAMQKMPVSDLVNSPAVDDERIIRPLFGLS